MNNTWRTILESLTSHILSTRVSASPLNSLSAHLTFIGFNASGFLLHCEIVEIRK